MKNATLVLFAALLVGSIAQAKCEISMDRTACPGKDAEARKPYNGKNPTDEKSKATDAEACLKDAEKQVKIVRKGTLAKKVATVKFDGKEIGKKEDSQACN